MNSRVLNVPNSADNPPLAPADDAQIILVKGVVTAGATGGEVILMWGPHQDTGSTDKKINLHQGSWIMATLE